MSSGYRYCITSVHFWEIIINKVIVTHDGVTIFFTSTSVPYRCNFCEVSELFSLLGPLKVKKLVAGLKKVFNVKMGAMMRAEERNCLKQLTILIYKIF